MKEFNLKLLVFTLVCAVFLFCWNMFSPAAYHDTISWFILLFFAFTTGLVHQYLIKASAGDGKAFVGKFMGMTGLKLLVYMLFLIVILITHRENARVIAIYFLGLYFLFAVFEVASLYKKLRK